MRPGSIPRLFGLSTALAGVIAAALLAPASASASAVTSASAGKAAATTTAAAPAPAVAAAPANFTHPGVNLNTAQLDFVRGRVQAGAQPWKAAYDQMLGSAYASLSRTAKPRAIVECGSYSNPNNGCTDEREDAIAAYTDALAWYITRDDRYAQKSIQLMDAWSNSIQDHTNSNAPLQTGWAGSSWPKAAEIIKNVYGNWPNSGRFDTMLRNVYLPKIINGSNSNGNWELTMMEAAVSISVYLNDKTSYDKAIGIYLTRVPAYIYLSSDGALPKTVPSQNLNTRDKIVSYWQGQSTFVTGLTQETCRDFVHTGYGISSVSHVFETARLQGQDLFPQVGERLRQALGFQSKYEIQAEPVPSSICGGSVTRGLGPITEVGFNALNTRLGYAMTNTQALTERQRPAGTNNLFVAWETLTNAQNPN
ncbi:alginate lyase family protein [Streptomyces sp. NPDC051569]|uniref:alginate lyase family protein n=1 Tax=Streptomyces sp. NPDC051569 TaxID=3365661 RepID=UPI0037BBF286